MPGIVIDSCDDRPYGPGNPDYEADKWRDEQDEKERAVSEDFPTRVQECDICREHYFSNPMLIATFASVGIELGKSTWEMAEEYFARFHKNKHANQ